jgi:hypothetical protein
MRIAGTLAAAMLALALPLGSTAMAAEPEPVQIAQQTEAIVGLTTALVGALVSGDTTALKALLAGGTPSQLAAAAEQMVAFAVAYGSSGPGAAFIAAVALNMGVLSRTSPNTAAAALLVKSNPAALATITDGGLRYSILSTGINAFFGFSGSTNAQFVPSPTQTSGTKN